MDNHESANKSVDIGLKVADVRCEALCQILHGCHRRYRINWIADYGDSAVAIDKCPVLAPGINEDGDGKIQLREMVWSRLKIHSQQKPKRIKQGLGVQIIIPRDIAAPDGMPVPYPFRDLLMPDIQEQ